MFLLAIEASLVVKHPAAVHAPFCDTEPMDDGELLGAAVILAVAVIVPSLLALFPSLIRYGTTSAPL